MTLKLTVRSEILRNMYRGKMTYEVLPAYNIVRDEKDDLATDCHSILARRRNHFSQLLNVHGVNNVRQTEVHTAEPLVPESSAFEVELANEKLKSHRSLGIDGKIILRWIFRKWDVGVWTGSSWLRIGTGGGLFLMQ
jgi:hypothetical protein